MAWVIMILTVSEILLFLVTNIYQVVSVNPPNMYSFTFTKTIVGRLSLHVACVENFRVLAICDGKRPV